MRLHFTFELEQEVLEIDYRRKILAYIKFCTEKYNKEFYHELYGNGNNTNKDFTFSVYFVPPTQFYKEYISIKSKRMILNFSTPDSFLGIQLYNALCGQKFIWYKLSGGNAIRLINITSEKEKIITQNQAVFNTLSPLVIRDHSKETGKDCFYTFEDEEAASILKRNLISELNGKMDRDISFDIKQLQINFVKMKKVIVSSYEYKIATSLGIITMKGEPYLLQYLYQRGIGGKRSLGFGNLELIQ
ncbi:CRISPR-associated endoribonuclease Cas6 [Anaerocolumna cellulosilytica]|uniref:CRISPR-associated endoribonuclease Cas6 n=1 Tax=Anaerocolumna cellulosilytica TaxID=433286 RepID=A0A6S6R7W1_9FIRM|nr:CRISPR-associated endoribonuclease Cas6 [Anaerocolumna cellulosilytica]MBB5197122.1 CRISPR-associated endoribonuclease Cas6 [Anaerocolumna cellulosilytica]BCJ95335.1 CRISPR-associated endoribonuclease Cas6 [Anaerocolumna cellulosilytica]